MPERVEILSMCDLRFLPQAVVLYRSLERHAGPFRLRMLCMDEHSRRFFDAAGFDNVELVPLAALEDHDPVLASLRAERSWTEYCWTATPAFCRMMLADLPDGQPLLWTDADVEFLRDPAELLADLGDGSVLLTPHCYYRTYPCAAPAWQLTELYGRFNGGTIVFRNDEQGAAAASLWRRRSIEWCYDRTEPGLFGNQLHLSDFPQRFSGASVLDVPGGGIGPWNSGRYRITADRDGVAADGSPLVFYHHQSLRLCRRPLHLRPLASPTNLFGVPGHTGGLVARTTPWYRLSRAERRLIWRPHVRRLAQAVADVAAFDRSFMASLETFAATDLRHDTGHRLRIGRSRIADRLRRTFASPNREVPHRAPISGTPEPDRAQP